jgi:hypothetical protein
MERDPMRVSLVTAITLITLVAGCTETYTVTLTDSAGDPVLDQPVALVILTGYGFFDIRHMIVGCSTTRIETTDASGQATFVMDHEWTVHDIAAGEQWVLDPRYEWGNPALPMLTQEELRNVHIDELAVFRGEPPKNIPLADLPGRPWCRVDSPRFRTANGPNQ